MWKLIRWVTNVGFWGLFGNSHFCTHRAAPVQLDAPFSFFSLLAQRPISELFPNQNDQIFGLKSRENGHHPF